MMPTPIPSVLVGRRVLVVDDDEDGRELLSELLREAGAEVETAIDAETAFAGLAAFKPDVLLCDVNMPGQNGYALMERIRALPTEHGGRVKAAAFTGFGRDEDRVRSARAGFDLHLTKPIDGGDLALALSALLSAPASSRT